MSADRTNKAKVQIEKFGGKVTAMFALLGDVDLVLLAEFPENEKAMQASVALTKLTGIAFTTLPAVSVEHFDTLVKEI
ncbi:MAG TPA: GYD domain-containing protein [bacterium]|nr:GYD domain-containing protein [bacterium]